MSYTKFYPANVGFMLLLVGLLTLNAQSLHGASITNSLETATEEAVHEAPSTTLDYWWNSSQEPSSIRLWSQTRVLLGVSVAALGVLYCMPENVTKWNSGKSLDELPDDWWQNVRRRPVWDKDNWFINYVGHPYCGGVYYQMARKSGYNQFNSFAYSAAVSTLFWEYGIEAFAERPSVQDLIVTPLGGWLYGECAYRWEECIEENQGQVLGSTLMGSVALFLLDPIDHFGKGLNRLVGKEWVLTGRVRPDSLRQSNSESEVATQKYAFAPRLHIGIERIF